MDGGFWNAPDRVRVKEGWLRLLSAREVLEARREGDQLARDGRERTLCRNACLVARALERDGRAVFEDGRAALDALRVEEIASLSDRWAELNRENNPSPADGERAVEGHKKRLEQARYERLRWRVLRLFGALPTEERARRMTDRDYLWCALNLALDQEEELGRLCPQCRAQAEEELCPVCGAARESWAVNAGFDWARYREMRGGEADDRPAGGAAGADG